MTLKTKYILLALIQSIVPFVLLILGQWIGMPAKSHFAFVGRIIGGAVLIVGIWIANWYQYQSAVTWKNIIASLRKGEPI